MNDLLLLAMLSAGPRHGYALKEQAGFFSGAGAMHNNLVYPLLRRFVSSGWVKRRSAPGQRGQTRHIYALTLRGRRTLLERLGHFDAKCARSAEAFHLRVALFHILDQPTRLRILDERLSYLKRRDAELAQVEQALNLSRYPGAVVAFLRRQAQAELDWIESLHRTAAQSARKKSKRSKEN